MAEFWTEVLQGARILESASMTTGYELEALSP